MSDTTTLNEADAKAELAEILKVARQNNQRQVITGALIFYREKGRFAQVLEVPEDAVKTLLASIKAGDAPARLFT